MFKVFFEHYRFEVCLGFVKLSQKNEHMNRQHAMKSEQGCSTSGYDISFSHSGAHL